MQIVVRADSFRQTEHLQKLILEGVANGSLAKAKNGLSSLLESTFLAQQASLNKNPGWRQFQADAYFQQSSSFAKASQDESVWIIWSYSALMPDVMKDLPDKPSFAVPFRMAHSTALCKSFISTYF